MFFQHLPYRTTSNICSNICCSGGADPPSHLLVLAVRVTAKHSIAAVRCGLCYSRERLNAPPKTKMAFPATPLTRIDGACMNFKAPASKNHHLSLTFGRWSRHGTPRAVRRRAVRREENFEDFEHQVVKIANMLANICCIA